MLDLQTLLHLFGRKINHPDYPDVKEVPNDSVYFDSLTRGLGLSGNPGQGKTTTAAGLLMGYATKYSRRPAVVYDRSGSLISKFLQIMEALPQDQYEKIRSRVVVDLLAHPHFVIPKPLFHDAYGLSKEDQIQKAVDILKELNHRKIEMNPTMATAIKDTAPELFRLIAEIKDGDGNSWQITEAKRLLVDISDGKKIKDKGLLAKALYKFGGQVRGAKFYLEHEVMQSKSPSSRESRRGSLITALGVIETDYLRARYGYPKPGVTYKEIIEKGLIYLVSGELLGNQESAQSWAYWDEFASLRAVINQRIPDDRRDKPVLLIIDEVYRLYEIEGMAKNLGEISTYYRNRKLMPVIIIQAFWQLEELLQQQYWNLGNLITFQMDNFDDAYKLTQQLFQYSAKEIKYNAPSDRSNPVAKTDREQYLERANWIQRLGPRRVLMRRYIDEQNKEDFVAYVDRTKQVEMANLDAEVIYDLKEQLVKKSGRAVHVRDALRIINARDIEIEEETPKRKGVKR